MVRIDNEIERLGLKADIMGPAPCPIKIIRRQHRRQLLLKTNKTTGALQWIKTYGYDDDDEQLSDIASRHRF